MLKGTSLSGSSQWELDPGLSIYKFLLQKCPAVLVLCFLPGSNLMIFLWSRNGQRENVQGYVVATKYPAEFTLVTRRFLFISK